MSLESKFSTAALIILLIISAIIVLYMLFYFCHRLSNAQVAPIRQRQIDNQSVGSSESAIIEIRPAVQI